ncbi:MAG TPA: peptidoglycan bridge formation glycyltransferase FemA/FemB family protein, partial [Anaerolineales bacterium]|nr:peptidoglycan bridge formation glycyltransferase FemA/FemB family protein [Anaerolineales bacterium]
VNLADWNLFLENHPDAHLLQMGEWGELKKDFGWKPIRFILDRETGAQILFRRLPLGLTLGYMPKPAFSDKLLAISDQFWKEVDSICKQHHAIFLKMEPDVWDVDLNLRPSTFNLSPHNIQPPRTITIDIKDSEETILARMKPKCRYNIRLAEKKGVTVRAWDDIPAFHEMLSVTGGRDNFGVHSREYYQRAFELFHLKGMCELLVAEYEGRPLASLMVFASGNRAWYVYGASNDRERNRMPTYLLQWQAIRWAKERGCEEYDLWGVPDENEGILEANFETRHDGLWGVYRFKRGFGGQLKRAAQALDKVYMPLLYKIYLWRFAGREGS